MRNDIMAAALALATAASAPSGKHTDQRKRSPWRVVPPPKLTKQSFPWAKGVQAMMRERKAQLAASGAAEARDTERRET